MSSTETPKFILLVPVVLCWSGLYALVAEDDPFGESPSPLDVPVPEIRFDHDLVEAVEPEAKRRVLDRRGARRLIVRVVPPETADSAVARGLKWLAAHQREDGSWRFAHTNAACPRACGPQGKYAEADPMATGVVLLAFLGAGQTHREGTYKSNVEKALEHLVGQMNEIVEAGDAREFQSGELGVAIGALALSEAYAMTADKSLVKSVRAAIDRIAATQDPEEHGWRINKMAPCSVELTAWQLMALKSAHMAYLPVPLKQVQKTPLFLDSVQHDGGAKYGYGKPNLSATAAALLSRMYLGWGGDDFISDPKFVDVLKRGTKWISEAGLKPGDPQYNFFAHQLLFHRRGSDEWRKWNDAMIDHLVEAQTKTGHAKGSWYFKGGEEQVKWGGRVYCTAMAIMTLEVYYRHLPVWRTSTIDRLIPE